MKYPAVITNFTFMPMVQLVPSILHYWVNIPSLNNRTIVMEAKGSIKDLSAQFGFVIEGDSSWDFTGFVGKKCTILKDDKGYHFLGFTD